MDSIHHFRVLKVVVIPYRLHAVHERQIADITHTHGVGTTDNGRIQPSRNGQHPQLRTGLSDLVQIGGIHRQVFFRDGNIVAGAFVQATL